MNGKNKRAEKRKFLPEVTLKLIPPRYVFAFTLTILKFLLIIGVVLWLIYKIRYFYFLVLLTQFVCVIKIISSDTNPDYKVPWLLFVLVLPVVGFMLYFVFSKTTLKRKYVKKFKTLKGLDYEHSDQADVLALKEENLTPYKVIEYKALAGDNSDNIPGCPGVGEKTAFNLLDTYGGLDGIFENVENIKGKLGERLRDNKEQVYLSKELATIFTEVPLDIELKDIAFDRKVIGDKFFMHLKELECFKLIPRFDFDKRFEGIEPSKINLGTPVKPLGEDSLPFEEVKSEIKTVFIRDISSLNNYLSLCKQIISLEIGNSICFSFDGNTEYQVICSESLLDEGVNFDQAILSFKHVLENENVTKIIFDVKDKMHSLQRYDVELKKPYEDVLLKSYLCNSNYSYKSAEDMISANGFNVIASGILLYNNVLNIELDKKELKSLLIL